MKYKNIWNSIKISPVNASVMYSIPDNSIISRKLTGFAIKYILKRTCNNVVVNPRFFENSFVLNQLNRWVPVPANILDIGSAESELTLYMHASGYKVTAFDQREFPFLPSVTGDAVTLTEYFKPNTFDALTVISTIEHIGIGAYGDTEHNISYSELLAIWKKVLKRNGYLFITTPVTSQPKRREKGQWVENISSMRNIAVQSGGKVLHEELIIHDHTLPIQWKKISLSKDTSFQLGVYMAVIQY